MSTRIHTALFLSTLIWSVHARAQEVAAGKVVFGACAACHSIDGTNGAGPSLKGVVGRKVGSYEGFRYSRAMKATAYTWDSKTLDVYLADPATTIPGNLMPFSGLSDPQQRRALIEYLATLK